MSRNSNRKNNFNRIKSLLPIVGILLLTISLLLYFGIQQFSGLVVKEGELIGDLYEKTLKQLFFDDKLTKEDVLNFALYNNLPVDKEKNKIIEVKNDLTGTGGDVIEVRYADIKDNTDNYSKFINKMNLSTKQKDELDSLLNAYGGNISNTIFSDDDKTLAIDSRIGLLHRLLRTELLDFIARIKSDKYAHLEAKKNTLRDFTKIIEQEKDKSLRDYIFFTPDTVIHKVAEYHSPEISGDDKILKLPKTKMPPVIKVLKKENYNKQKITPSEKVLSYNIDSNLVKVVLDEEFFKNLEIEKYHELKPILDSSSDKFEISIGIPSAENSKFEVSSKQADSNHVFHFELNLEDLGKIISNSVKFPTDQNIKEWEEFGLKMDSLSLKLQELKIDSLVNVE